MRIQEIADYRWLDAWQSNLKNQTVLELGAGSGADTRLLRNQVANLTATDLTANSELGIKALDHSQPLPFRDNSFTVVIASLTLHYFSWLTTVAIIKEIKRILQPSGLLICRLNSTNDIHYGAVGYEQIEPGLFNVKGQAKRFFSEQDIQQLWQRNTGWQIEACQEKQIDRYLQPKTIWEFAARVI